MDIALKWLTLLHNPEDIVEIRSIDPKPVISGYFKADSAAIAKEIARFPNRTFYQTLQMVQPACYARGQHEHLMERPRETTSDNDIAGYQWIPLKNFDSNILAFESQKRFFHHYFKS